MRKLFLLLSALVIVLGCSGDGKKPDNLLPKETMVRVLADMQIAEAKVKNLHLPLDSTRKLYALYELSIFEKYNVSSQEYLDSYKYYLENYNEMQAINNALLDTLNSRQNQIPQ